MGWVRRGGIPAAPVTSGSCCCRKGIATLTIYVTVNVAIAVRIGDSCDVDHVRRSPRLCADFVAGSVPSQACHKLRDARGPQAIADRPTTLLAALPSPCRGGAKPPAHGNGAADRSAELSAQRSDASHKAL